MDPDVNATVFDAADMLKIGTPPTDPLPDAEPGFVTLRVPDGLTLQAIRDSAVGAEQSGNHVHDRHIGGTFLDGIDGQWRLGAGGLQDLPAERLRRESSGGHSQFQYHGIYRPTSRTRYRISVDNRCL